MGSGWPGRGCRNASAMPSTSVRPSRWEIHGGGAARSLSRGGEASSHTGLAAHGSAPPLAGSMRLNDMGSARESVWCAPGRVALGNLRVQRRCSATCTRAFRRKDKAPKAVCKAPLGSATRTPGLTGRRRGFWRFFCGTFLWEDHSPTHSLTLSPAL